MHRVLDIDLDFFVQPVAHWVDSAGARLPDDEYSCWSTEEVSAFLRDQCGLDRRLPGWVIEHHDEAFAHWRAAVDSGQLPAPFHVTHVDAHADLGLGDAGYVHLITDVMHRPVDQRAGQDVVEPALNFGNWLAFAVACQWVAQLDYVFGPGGGSDLLGFHLSDDFKSLEMKAATKAELDRALHSGGQERLGGAADPPVPLRQIRAEDFTADAPYDSIVLCRSPGFTPPSADEIFDMIRSEYVDDVG